MSHSRIITLNVGGTLFMVARSTLAQAPDGLLASLAGGDNGWDHDAMCDEAGRPFICRDAAAFPAILTFLRTGVAWAPAAVPLPIVRGEFDFYFAVPPPVFRAEHLDLLAHPVLQLMQPWRGLVDDMRAGLWNVIDKWLVATDDKATFPGESADDVTYVPLHIGRDEFVAPCIPAFEAYDQAAASDPTMARCLDIVAYIHTRTRIAIVLVYMSGARRMRGDRNAHARSAADELHGSSRLRECLETMFAADKVETDFSDPSHVTFTLVWYSTKHA